MRLLLQLEAMVNTEWPPYTRKAVGSTPTTGSNASGITGVPGRVAETTSGNDLVGLHRSPAGCGPQQLAGEFGGPARPVLAGGGR